MYIYLLKVFVDLQLSQGQKHQGLIHSESLKSTLNLSKDIRHSLKQEHLAFSTKGSSGFPGNHFPRLCWQISKVSDFQCYTRSRERPCWLCNGSKTTCFIWSTIPTWSMSSSSGWRLFKWRDAGRWKVPRKFLRERIDNIHEKTSDAAF